MNPTLLRLSFFVFTCALLFGGFSKEAEAQSQELNTVWERSERTGAEQPRPDWFEPGFVRGMAYGTVDGNERIYAIDRNSTTIRIIDPETGDDIDPATAYDLSGVDGGLFLINDGDLSDDGKLFVGSLSTEAETEEGAFQLYMWENEGGAFSSSFTIQTPERVRLGDNFTVTGSVEDNTVEIWIPVQSSDPGVIYVVTTDDQGSTWNSDTITLSGDNVSIPANAVVGFVEHGGDFYIAGNGSSPKRYTNSGEYIPDSQFVSGSFTGARNSVEIFEVDGISHLAAYTYNDDPEVGSNTNRTGRVYVYDISDPTAPQRVASSPLMGDDTDTFSSTHGDIYVRLNDDNSYTIYALEGVNGFTAFTSAEAEESLARLQVIHNAADPGAASVDIYVNGELYEGDFDFRSATEFRSVPAGVELDIAVAAAGSSDAGDAIATFQFTLDEDETYVLIANGVLDDSDFDTSVNSDISFDLFAVGDVREEAADGDDVDFFVFHGATDAPAVDVRAGETVLVDNASYGDATSYLSVSPDVYNLDVTLTGDAEAIAASFTVDLSASAGASAVVLASGFLDPAANNDGASFALALALADGTMLVIEPDADAPSEPLSGEYFIPQGDNEQGFESLAAAIAAVNELGLSGETTLFIDADLEENEQLRISRDDLSENTRLYIRPSAGQDVTIRTNDFRLVDTGYITVDGSANGSDERNLTFEKNDEGAGFIGLLSNTVDVQFQNVNIVYDEDFGSSTYAVLINRREGGEDTGRADNVTFNNVQIGSEARPFNDAFWLFGSTTAEQYFHRDVTISNNELSVRRSALRTQTHINTVFDGNKVDVYSTGSGDVPAVNLNTPVETFTYTNNEVSFESSANEDAATFIGLNATNSLVNDILIANNTVSNANFTSSGSAENSFYAFRHNGAATVAEFQVYHNTVYFTDVGQTGEHSAIGLGGSGSTAASLTATNNIFVNDRSASNSFIYQWFDEELSADYNNIIVADGGFVALIDGAEFELLIDWNDIGQDENSSEAEVEFVSETDLRLTGGSIGDNDLAGTPLAAVTTDIDGTQRSELAPYKGAFEGDVELMGDVEIGPFALLFPEDGFDLQLMDGDADTEVEISWEAPNATGDVTYIWHADSLGGDFSDPLLSIPSDGDGTETTLTLDYQTIDLTLSAQGVAEGETANLIWTVTAETDTDIRFANEPFELSITRNLGVSREITENPQEFSLSQNYPNPFNPTSTIEFTLPAATDVKLEVYNINGQLVSTLVDSRMNAGQHSVVFDASNLASGVYLYRIIAGNFVETRQMTLIK